MPPDPTRATSATRAPHVWTHVWTRLVAARLPLLELLLFGWALLHVAQQAWVGDFFEHASVVRELAAHPLHPGHPQLALVAPHPFYSPYAWLLGLVSRLSGADPMAVLAAAGLANLGLLLVGLRRFVALWADPGREEPAAFYALVFVLLLWGTSPWGFSGFFHLGVFGVVLPYPSTFAAGLSLVALRLQADRLRSAPPGGSLLPRLLVVLVLGVVLLTHPLTFIFLVCGLGAVTLAFAPRPLREAAVLAGMGAIALVLAALWPLYPFVDLVTSGTAGFHEPNRVMYVEAFGRMGLAWLGLPVLAIRLWRNPRDGLALTALALGAVYALGGLTDRWSYGRVVAYVALCLQIALAVAMAWLEARVAARSGRPELARLGLATLVGLVLVAVGWGGLVRPALKRVKPGAETTLMQLAFLERHLRPGDLVLADLRLAGIPPALAARVVASNRPQPFVEGHAEREADVVRFFSPEATDAERHAVLRRYRPRFVLRFERDPAVAAALAASVADEMRIVHQDEDFLLLEASQDESVHDERPEPDDPVEEGAVETSPAEGRAAGKVPAEPDPRPASGRSPDGSPVDSRP